MAAPIRPHSLHRRGFLQAGMLGRGGLSLPNLLRAEAAAGIKSSTKSVIFIYLVGGPPHQDMFDLKPDAPKEIAGPWKPIATNVTGIKICEAFPQLARLMDKMTIIRSLVATTTPSRCSTVTIPKSSNRQAVGRSSVPPSRACSARRTLPSRRLSASVTPAPMGRTTSQAVAF